MTKFLTILLVLVFSCANAQVVTHMHKKKATSSTPPPISFGVVTAASLTGAPGRTGDGSLTVTLPTSWAAGQVAILAVWNDQGDASTPTGWTEITGSPFGDATPKVCVFSKVLWSGTGDPVTTISGSGSGISHVGAIITYNNVDTTSIFDVIGVDSAGTGATISTYGVTTTYDSSWVLVIAARGDNEDVNSQTINTSGTGVTERTDAGTNSGDDCLIDFYDKAIDTKGATGAGAATTSITDPWVSVMLGLKRRQY